MAKIIHGSNKANETNCVESIDHGVTQLRIVPIAFP
jgi:hypothetical protein